MENNSEYKRPRSRRLKSELTNCQDCTSLLTVENWSKSNQEYGRYMCKTCWNLRQKKYNKQTKEEKAAKAKDRQSKWSNERKLAEKEKSYRRSLKTKYDLSLEEYNTMLLKQNHRCKICNSPNAKGRGCMHVDHCHETGKIRGLLCARCNLLLGKAEDNISILTSAIEYLKENGKDHKHDHN